MDTNNENKQLTICIPTYNRANLLRENLVELISNVKDKNIPIYISDNCSTDNTELVVNEIKKSYKYIHYYKQEKNIFDDNFPFILKQTSSDFAWLLGDKSRIAADWIQKIFEIFESIDNLDALVVNQEGLRVKSVPNKLYTNQNELLVDIGWHMTLISSLILSKSLISRMDFDRYKGTNFMHLAPLFESIAYRDFKILWINEPIILYPKKQTGLTWRTDIFKIFLEIWGNTILSLPPIYTLDSKLKCIKKHGIESKIFSWRHLAVLRRDNIFNLIIFLKYRKYFSFFTNIPYPILFLISIFPKFLIRARRRIRDILTFFAF
jgi:abequosyltransferase